MTVNPCLESVLAHHDVTFGPTALGIADITFIKTTYDISLDSQISLLPLGFSLLASSPLVTVFDWDARSLGPSVALRACGPRENPEVTRNLFGGLQGSRAPPQPPAGTSRRTSAPRAPADAG